MSRHSQFRAWFIILTAALLTIAATSAVAVGALIGFISRMPSLTVLEDYSPPGVTRIYDRTGNTKLADYFNENRHVIPIADIPQHVVNAFIAIEDERFFEHFGIDLQSIARALTADVHARGKAQGASTITMQVARNVVLRQTKKTFGRKIRELLTALQIEHLYSKQQILQFYLNQIFLGAGAYGVEAAAKAYFDKDVKDLSIPEAALLAALPKAPSQLSPFQHKKAAMARRNLVLANMRRLGYIKSDAELREYENTPIELHPPEPTPQLFPYYTDYVRSVMMARESAQTPGDLGDTPSTINASVDLPLQTICEEELSKGLRQVQEMIQPFDDAEFADEEQTMGSVSVGQTRLVRISKVSDTTITVQLNGHTGQIRIPDKLPYFNPEQNLKVGKLVGLTITSVTGNTISGVLANGHVQGAMVLIDVPSGQVLALVGGDSFLDAANDGQWNRAVQGGRQPGSSWKPLLYASAFDEKDSSGRPRFTPGSVELDEPITIGEWSPKNYENNFLGPMALFEALVHSRNVPTVRLFLDIGPKRAVGLYHRFNLVNIPSEWNLPAVPPMALGTPNITPLELTAAYSIFANGGVGTRPIAVRSMMIDSAHPELRVTTPESAQVLSPEAAYMTTRILEDVIHKGTAKETVGKWLQQQIEGGRPMPEMAGKTGTTNDAICAWFVGFTPQVALGICVAYDHTRSLGPKMTGSRVVGPMWSETMDRILQTRNDWKMKFDVPAGIEFADICSKSGKLMTDACVASGDDVFPHAAFKKGTAPTSYCDYHGGGRRVASR